MGMKLVVASVGVRDIRYRHDCTDHYRLGKKDQSEDCAIVAGQLWQCPEDAQMNIRAISKEIFCRVNTHRLDLKTPILTPALNYIFKNECQIDKLILIVTDQSHPVFRTQDTIYCGELIAHRLSSDKRIRQGVELFRISNDPHRSDHVYPIVREMLMDNADDVDRFYAFTQPSIPAISEGLRHAGRNVFGDRCTVVSVDEPSDDKSGADEGTASKQSLEPFLKDAARLSARALIEHDNYAGALDVLEGFGASHWLKPLIFLLKHASARVNLARSQAKKAHSKVEKYWPEMPKDLSTSLELPKGNLSALGYANEVRFLIESALDQERYADALFRIALFRESCEAIFAIGWLFRNIPEFGARIKYYQGDPPETGKPWIESTSGLDVVLIPLRISSRQTRNIGGHKIGGWPVSKPGVKRAIFKYAYDDCTAPQWNSLKKVIGWEAFDCLKDLRDSAIHTPTGVSKGNIESCIKVPGECGEEPLMYLRRKLGEIIDGLYDFFSGSPSDNPYRVIKREMLILLDS